MVPERRREQTFMVRGLPRKVGTWMALVGGGLWPGQAHIGELVLAVIGPCWVPSAPDACDTNRPARPTRWPFSRVGFRDVWGW